MLLSTQNALPLPSAMALETALKSYSWIELWQMTKAIPENAADMTNVDTSRLDVQRALAFKAMLLMDQWHLKDEALALLAILPDNSSDALLHFARVYTYLVMADKEKVLHYSQFIPANAPDWIRRWLNLEFYGRSLQFKAQARLLTQWFSKGSTLPDYVMVALLKTLDHDKANLLQLKKCIRQHGITFTSSVLSNALQRLLQLPDVPYPKQVDAAVLHQIAKGFQRGGALKHALKAYDQLAKMGYLDQVSLNNWMLLGLCSSWGWPNFTQRAEHALRLAPPLSEVQGRVAARLLVYYWLNRDYGQAFSCLQKFADFKVLPSTEGNLIPQVFFKYTLKLCVAWQRQPQAYQPPSHALPLHVLGESHCLSPSNRVIHLQGQCYQAQGHIIWGVKMFHLGGNQGQSPHEIRKILFDSWIEQIPSHEALMLTIGEIDLRPDEGVWKNSYLKGQSVQAVLETTIDGYITHLSQALKKRQALTIIQGIPAPAYSLETDDRHRTSAFLAMIEAANHYLKIQTINQGWQFLDIYQATVDETTKRSNGRYHLDSHHLAPRFYDDIELYLSTTLN